MPRFFSSFVFPGFKPGKTKLEKKRGRGMGAFTQGGGPPALRSGGPCPGLLSRCPFGAQEPGGVFFVGREGGGGVVWAGAEGWGSATAQG